jgi:hypothetical protein
MKYRPWWLPDREECFYLVLVAIGWATLLIVLSR